MLHIMNYVTSKSPVMKTGILLSAASILLFGCTSNQELTNETNKNEDLQTSAIRPLEGISSDPLLFSVDAIRRDTILLGNGGSVIFQENSFVDDQGHPVSGMVNVHWQEFHSLADIAVSGIPMRYDSSGISYDLVSGGMFTIRATQGAKKLQLASGKQATVNLISMQDTPCYNFYELDETTGKWDYQSTATAEIVHQENVRQLASSKKENMLLDMREDVRPMPELNQQEIVGWVAADPLDAETETWLESNFAATKLLRRNADGTYQVEVKIRKRTEEFRIRPYTTKEAQLATRKKERKLQADLDEILAYQQRLAVGKVVRSIEIPNFGTYNWDIAYKRKNSVIFAANFEFPVKTNKSLISLFLISPDENAVVKYDATGSDLFSYDPDKRNCLIAIMPDNRLMVVDNENIRKVRKSSTSGKVTGSFEFKDAGVTVRSAADIENHL